MWVEGVAPAGPGVAVAHLAPPGLDTDAGQRSRIARLLAWFSSAVPQVSVVTGASGAACSAARTLATKPVTSGQNSKPDSCGSSSAVKYEPLCRNSPANVPGARPRRVQCGQRAEALADQHRPALDRHRVAQRGDQPVRRAPGAYAGLAAYLLLRATRGDQRDPHPRQASRADHRTDVRRQPAVGVHLRAVVADQQRQALVGARRRPATRSRRRSGRPPVRESVSVRALGRRPARAPSHAGSR